jgi:hypothetical protein
MAMRPPDHHLFLCLFFLSFFLRLWVAIFLNLRFLPQGTSMSPWAPGPVIKSFQYATNEAECQAAALPCTGHRRLVSKGWNLPKH